LLRSGKSVVSPTAATHHRHLARADAFVAGLDAAGAEGHATAAFVGLDPGFFTDALPLTFASTVGRVAQLRTYEVLSYAHYPKIDTLRCLDPGAAPDGIADQVQGMIRPTRGGAPYALADAVGVALDGIEIEVKVETAPETFTTPGGMTVERGTVAGLNFRVTGLVDGAPRFVVNHGTRLRDDGGPLGERDRRRPRRSAGLPDLSRPRPAGRVAHAVRLTDHSAAATGGEATAAEPPRPRRPSATGPDCRAACRVGRRDAEERRVS
jgi:hypothetical protein